MRISSVVVTVEIKRSQQYQSVTAAASMNAEFEGEEQAFKNALPLVRNIAKRLRPELAREADEALYYAINTEQDPALRRDEGKL